MRRLLVLFAFLLALPSWAQVTIAHRRGSPASPYMARETFDPTGSPGTDLVVCGSAPCWTTVGATPDTNNTTQIFNSSQSLLLDYVGNDLDMYRISPSGMPTTAVDTWAAFVIQFKGSLGGGYTHVSMFQDGSGTPVDLAWIEENSTSTLDCCYNAGNNCISDNQSAWSVSVGTTYYVKMRYRKSNGTASAQFECWVSTSATSWGTSKTITSGSWTTGNALVNPVYVQWKCSTGVAANGCYVDEIRVDNEDLATYQ